MPYDFGIKLYEGEDDYCFVSYKKEDAETIKSILQNLNFRIWLDNGIIIGDSWETSIEKHLLKSSVILMFLSPAVFDGNPKNPVILEYKIAEKENKTIVFVELENITNIPEGNKTTFEKIDTSRRISYHKGKSIDELTNEIAFAVKQVAGQVFWNRTNAINSSIGIGPTEFEMSSISDRLGDRIRYYGFINSHITNDFKKICVFNEVKKKYEIRLISEPRLVVSQFTSPFSTFDNSCLFFTPHDEMMWCFNESNTLFRLNVKNGTWLKKNGTAIRLEKGETIKGVFQFPDSCTTYLLTSRYDYYHRFICYDLFADKQIGSYNVDSFGLKFAIPYDFLSKEYSLFVDEKNKLILVNWDSICLYNADAVILHKEASNEDDFRYDINWIISKDAKLFSTVDGSRIIIHDSDSSNEIFEEYIGAFQDILLLKNKTILKYDNNGNVFWINGNKQDSLLKKDYFMKNSFYERSLPHTLYYDEKNNRLIFVYSVIRENDQLQRIAIVNNKGTLISLSNLMRLPFDSSESFHCTCRLIKGQLVVFFSSEKAWKKNKLCTAIYVCDYDAINATNI